jgi:phage terminase small subunit
MLAMVETTPKRRPRGVPNPLPEPLPSIEDTDFGPAMKALRSDRHRMFVLALYSVRPGHGAQVRAAKAAGFGTTTTSPQSWSVIASRLAHDEKIQAALAEEDQKRIRASAPRAVRALAAMVENSKHKDHARAVGMVLDRVHPTETISHHTVDVTHNHKIGGDEAGMELLELMQSFEVPRSKLIETFGANGLPRLEEKLAARGPRPPITLNPAEYTEDKE